MRRTWRLGAVMAALVSMGSTGSAAAQWGTLPNGNPSYEVDYNTRGTFGCAANAIQIGSCTANGNTATLTRDGMSLTMTFEAVSARAHASTESATIALGTITSVVSGGTVFVPPSTFTPMTQFLYFSLVIATTAPTVTSSPRSVQLAAYPEGLRLLSFAGEYGFHLILLPTVPDPTGRYRMPAVRIADITHPSIPYSSAVVPFTAQIALVPEPSTYALFGTGLLGLAGIARRKRAAS